MMTAIDYSIFYRKKYDDPEEFINEKYDVFISAFNNSERVQKIFEKINADNKFWLVLPEYKYAEDEYPKDGSVYAPNLGMMENDVIIDFFEQIKINITTSKICIDITGFIRPHLVFLIRYLSINEISVIDFIYTDPITYKKKENTEFSDDYVEVRQIAGCEGEHNPEIQNDFLIIGSGYDTRRIADVAKNKAHTKKVQVFGLPSLQPDMFQENILRAYLAEESSSDGRQSFIDPDFTIFAPANDPFITANLLHSFIIRENKKKLITNLYLSPMATKAQTLGFALYYVTECIKSPVSVIFPFCKQYSRETTEGIAKIWKYTVEFNELKKIQNKINNN